MTTLRARSLPYIFAAFLGLASFASYSETISEEYQVKAALLFKLTKFIDWPSYHNANFTICVYGDNPFGNILTQLQSRKTRGLPIEVRQKVTRTSELDQCEILFVSKEAMSESRSVLMKVAHSSVVTISDINNFADSGGMIELTSKNNRVTFKINNARAKRAGIRIASPLLELATLVDEG